MDSLRLLVDPPLSGPANMALDEALLTSCAAPDARPTLRFYAWSPPTLSLGYFQDHAEYTALPPPAGDLCVVRRTTGGGAILHDLEVTYSLVIPAGHPLVRNRPNELYRLAHHAVILAVGHGVRLAGPETGSACGESSQRGPFFCFARRHALDVVVDDPLANEPATSAPPPSGRQQPIAIPTAKLAGSAQRRTPRAILQHGSIILDSRFPQQPCATWKQLGGVDAFVAAVERLSAAFEQSLGLRAELESWRDEEIRASEAIMRKYCGDAWNVHRRRD